MTESEAKIYELVKLGSISEKAKEGLEKELKEKKATIREWKETVTESEAKLEKAK